MNMSEIIEIIAVLGVIGGIVITINRNKNIRKNHDSNKINHINQKGRSGRDTYQSGRDTNVRK